MVENKITDYKYWNVLKIGWYLLLSGVKAFMSSLVIIMGFFVERFFIAKYVDITLAETIVPLINRVAAIWDKLFLIMIIFFWIINFRELIQSEKKKDGTK